MALLATVSIVVYAVGYEYTISAGDNFISIEAGDDLNEVAQKLNMTTKELNDHFNQTGLIYLAVSEDNQTQVKISAFSDNFSTKVEDISYLDKQGLSTFVEAISEDADAPAQVIENNGRKFLCVKDTLTDSGGIYTVTQYVTICNNKTFYFAGYNPGEDTSDEIKTMFKSFNLKEITQQKDNTSNWGFDWKYFLINSGVVVFGVITILSIIGIVLNTHKNSKEKHKNEN